MKTYGEAAREMGGVIHTFFIICIAYFIIPIDIVGYKSYNPIMFVGIIGFII